jgi:hypothetical protein
MLNLQATMIISLACLQLLLMLLLLLRTAVTDKRKKREKLDFNSNNSLEPFEKIRERT